MILIFSFEVITENLIVIIFLLFHFNYLLFCHIILDLLLTLNIKPMLIGSISSNKSITLLHQFFNRILLFCLLIPPPPLPFGV
jgi:hypothetical protein